MTRIGVHVDVHIGENFLNLCAGGFTGPKTTEHGYFRGDVCNRGPAPTVQFRNRSLVKGISPDIVKCSNISNVQQNVRNIN